MDGAPFTTAQFFEVFRRYNEAVWPAQWVLYGLALAAVAIAWRGRTRAAGRVIGAILAALWLWMGAVYHLMFFRSINPGATLFAILFVAEAAAFAWIGVWRSDLTVRLRPDGTGAIGALLILYALAVYPTLGYVLGHRYPAAPTFGLPCPTTIFTLGLLFWVHPIPRTILVIPILWTALGAPAAFQFGVREDLGLVVAGVLAAIVLLPKAPLIPTARRAA